MLYYTENISSLTVLKYSAVYVRFYTFHKLQSTLVQVSLVTTLNSLFVGTVIAVIAVIAVIGTVLIVAATFGILRCRKVHIKGAQYK